MNRIQLDYCQHVNTEDIFRSYLGIGCPIDVVPSLMNCFITFIFIIFRFLIDRV